MQIIVYLGGPVAPSCTINKTKSSSSCLQLELVFFITFASESPAFSGQMFVLFGFVRKSQFFPDESPFWI